MVYVWDYSKPSKCCEGVIRRVRSRLFVVSTVKENWRRHQNKIRKIIFNNADGFDCYNFAWNEGSNESADPELLEVNAKADTPILYESTKTSALAESIESPIPRRSKRLREKVQQGHQSCQEEEND